MFQSPFGNYSVCLGNAIFSELIEAIFKLERDIMPNRPPSSMVAINRRAGFRPHIDAGAGFGQTTSLIVGLGLVLSCI